MERHNIPIPPLCTDYTQFQTALREWKTAFIKPQFGALGQNVHFVQEGENLPRYLEGVVPNRPEQSILQKAISPPKEWAGLSVRHLLQRAKDASWISRPAVLRRSRKDPVVNVARGAEAVLASDYLPPKCMVSIEEFSYRTAIALQNSPNGTHAVEFGIDYVIDQEYNPWLIEVNSRPRGRLEVLAEQNPRVFTSIHQEACIQPILYLATLVDQ